MKQSQFTTALFIVLFVVALTSLAVFYEKVYKPIAMQANGSESPATEPYGTGGKGTSTIASTGFVTTDLHGSLPTVFPKDMIPEKDIKEVLSSTIIAPEIIGEVPVKTRYVYTYVSNATQYATREYFAKYLRNKGNIFGGYSSQTAKDLSMTGFVEKKEFHMTVNKVSGLGQVVVITILQ